MEEERLRKDCEFYQIVPEPAELDMQTQVLGERIYHLVAATQPTLAGKITGMILECYSFPEELLTLIKDSNALNKMVNESLKVLKEYDETQQKAADLSSHR